jgi:hypothetical protein
VSVGRVVGVIASVLVLGVRARTASADPAEERHVCETQFDVGQKAWHAHRLVEARPALVVCAHDPCDPMLQKPCQEWLADVEARVGSIVITVHEASGADVTRADVSVDGSTARLDGNAMDLDPGEHHVKVTVGAFTEDRTILLTESEKRRSVAFQLPVRSHPVPLLPAPHATPWAATGFGIVAAVAVTSVVVFGSVGLAQRASMCPNGVCQTTGIVNAIEGWYITSDASLGTAVVAGVVSLVLFLTHHAPSVPVARAAFAF